jgi:hypothetical protein
MLARFRFRACFAEIKDLVLEVPVSAVTALQQREKPGAPAVVNSHTARVTAFEVVAAGHQSSL